MSCLFVCVCVYNVLFVIVVKTIILYDLIFTYHKNTRSLNCVLKYLNCTNRYTNVLTLFYSMNVMNTIIPMPTNMASTSFTDCQTEESSRISGITDTVAM